MQTASQRQSDLYNRKRIIKVQNIPDEVSVDLLFQCFAQFGKILDLSLSNCVAIIKFEETYMAENALHCNGAFFFDKQITVAMDVPRAVYHIFVGDIGTDVDDHVLTRAFISFNCCEARVMWDYVTGKSRGYGFVGFATKQDASIAIKEMNGEKIGNRTVRCNWAASKSKITEKQKKSIQEISSQSPHNTTVYIGNLHLVDYNTIHLIFGPFGQILDVRPQFSRGYAFVTMDTHENAALAIQHINGMMHHGKPLKCAWGKERFSEADPLYYTHLYPYAYYFPPQIPRELQ